MTDAKVPLLTLDGLSVEFATRNGLVRAVEAVNLSVDKGETLGIVGESGSGKSVTSYALLHILDRAGRIAGGAVSFGGIDLTRASESTMRTLRGREISMIFQNPRAALNPIRKVGHQIGDVLRQHALATRQDVEEKVIDTLRQVRISDPEARYHAYPFELSGGMCQRIVIAIALACRPQLLIADEPTTGLDVTTQKAIMDLVVELARERHMATILITHDLGLASAYCDRIVVMQAGRIVEAAPARTLFAAPRHDYTRKLIRATPRRHSSLADLVPGADIGAPPAADGEPLLEVRDLVKEYPLASAGGAGLLARWRKPAAAGEAATFRAVDGISFAIGRGESVGLVGESGCGKSTTSSMVTRLLDPTAGLIRFDGENIGAIPAKDFARSPRRRAIQMVFQDATDSLNPRYTSFDSIADPLYRLGGIASRDRAVAEVEALADMVGLQRALLWRFPHQLSGGQKARVGIARAIALRPKLLILDEPTAALDVSVQAVVLALLARLRTELAMSYIFVSHDLNVVRLLCDRVIVMQRGRIVEQGPAEQLLDAPADPYTQSLVAAIPHFA